MDWTRVRSKRKEIIIVVTVLALLFAASLQMAAANADTEGLNPSGEPAASAGGLDNGGSAEGEALPPEGEGGDSSAGAPEETDTSLNQSGGSLEPDEGDPAEDGEGALQASGGFISFAPASADFFDLNSVTSGSGGNNQVVIDLSEGEVTAKVDAAQAYQFRLFFEGDLPTEDDMKVANNLRIVPINGQGTGPGGQNQNITTGISIEIITGGGGGGNQPHVRVQISGNALSYDTVYFLVLGEALLGVGNSVVIKFTTDEAPPPSASADFAAVFVYPSASSTNAAVGQPITIVFTQDVDSASLAGSVSLTAGGDVVEINYALGSDKKTLTVTPQANLNYGTEYTLTLAKDIENGEGEILPDEASVTFRTKTFDITGVSHAIEKDADGNYETLTGITVSLNNLAGGNSVATVKVVVRRDQGARLGGGGTVVYIDDATGTGSVVFSGGDITKDLYGAAIIDPSLDTYIDVYVLDENGSQIGDPLHLKI